jgi:hypothetical protein
MTSANVVKRLHPLSTPNAVQVARNLRKNAKAPERFKQSNANGMSTILAKQKRADHNRTDHNGEEPQTSLDGLKRVTTVSPTRSGVKLY